MVLLCVKRAVEMANEAANSDGKCYTLGPIIHNPQVVGRLGRQRVSPVQEVFDIAEGTMIIASWCRTCYLRRGRRKGLYVVDATCPHVKSTARCKVCYR